MSVPSAVGATAGQSVGVAGIVPVGRGVRVGGRTAVEVVSGAAATMPAALVAARRRWAE
ncbi:MAG: hypothetical protein ABI780_04220 [Ardenticatenales bacterium]